MLYWLLFSTASEAAFWLQEFYTFTSVKAIYIYCNDYCFPRLQKCQCYVAITAVSHSFRSTSALLQWLLFSTASEVPVLCCNDCCFPQLQQYQCSAVLTAVFHSFRSCCSQPLCPTTLKSLSSWTCFIHDWWPTLSQTPLPHHWNTVPSHNLRRWWMTKQKVFSSQLISLPSFCYSRVCVCV